MRGAPWKTLGVLAVFSPAAWQKAGRAARELVVTVRNMVLAVTLVVGAAAWWFQQQTRPTQVVTVLATLAVLGLMAGPRLRVRRPHVRRPHARRRPASQVLYRWWEPDDLPHGLRCACGKTRIPGELVYVGITGAHRSRERDDDRRAACWWNVEPSVVGTQELYRTRDEVERAEIEAIRAERPRENVRHQSGWW